MLDIAFIRDNPEKVKQAAHDKGYQVDIDRLLALDAIRRTKLSELEGLQARRNELSRLKSGAKPDQSQIEQGKQLKEKISQLEDELQKSGEEYRGLLLAVPNIPWEDVPVGQSEAQNQVVKTVGEKPQFDFEPKNHWQIAQAKDWIDKERAAKTTGARFAYLKGDLVRLQWALMSFAVDQLTDEAVIEQIISDNKLHLSSKPFLPVLPPALIKTDIYSLSGRLDAQEQTYKLADDELWLNASAEHSLCTMHQGEILTEKDLPLRYLGYATSFRREAGSYGKDTEGIFRLHQFDKLEMESFSVAKESFGEHLLQIAIQEYLMQKLELPYQVLNKCTADIGKPNVRGIDINTWLAGQNEYRETHTADFMTDYQARGLQTRVRLSDGQLEFAHTNDATTFSQRPLIAIIENNQTAKGDVVVPDVLRQYMKGRPTI